MKRIRGYLGFEALLLCDLLAACVAIDSSVATETVQARVTVETGGMYSRGFTVIDERMADGGKPNTTICLACDRSKIEAMFLEAINAR